MCWRTAPLPVGAEQHTTVSHTLDDPTSRTGRCSAGFYYLSICCQRKLQDVKSPKPFLKIHNSFEACGRWRRRVRRDTHVTPSSTHPRWGRGRRQVCDRNTHSSRCISQPPKPGRTDQLCLQNRIKTQKDLCCCCVEAAEREVNPLAGPLMMMRKW